MPESLEHHPGEGGRAAGEGQRPEKRRFSLAGKLLFLVMAHVLLAAAAGAALSAWVSAPWAVFGAAALAGTIAALASVRSLGSSATRGLSALEDGVRSLRDSDYSLRLAVTRRDELGDLVDLYNQMADALREERQDVKSRELLLDTVLQGAPLAILLVRDNGRIVLSNRAARSLLGGGHRLEGRTFDEVLAACPPELTEALSGEGSSLFTVPARARGGGVREGSPSPTSMNARAPEDRPAGGAAPAAVEELGPTAPPPGQGDDDETSLPTGQGDDDETYRAVRRVFHLDGRRHVLVLVERLTPELRRREVEVWKKVIRVMSHEMNNSLAPIRSLVHSARAVLRRPEHAHRIEDIFDTVEERATHLAEFLEGYARFARLARPRKTDVAWDPFLVSIARLEPFHLEGAPPAKPGRFDAVQMQQVLLNLLKNARESGSPDADIRVAVAATAEGGVAIRVTDRGRGMSDEVLAQALVPFYSDKPLGTGLGLPLCSEILEAHGGRLRLQNRDGGGLAVTCLLPP
jgi:two-component system nitrogen regulation sensor histidine kinase NtrY